MRVPSRPAPEQRPAQVQHVWIDLTLTWSAPVPGILLAWQRSPQGRWQGWVVMVTQAADAHGGGARMVMDWVEGAAIRPASGGVPMPDTSWARNQRPGPR